jgi:phenylalanyl-tRNA synthetase beta chain
MIFVFCGNFRFDSMTISLSWLRDFLDIDLPVSDLEKILTSTGLEVESVQRRGVNIDNVVVAQIQESVQHPDADRLSVCQVDDGSGTFRQIVCGAKNYKVGDKVPLALPGAVLPGDFKIKVGKLRGVKSEGMMCSGKELGLSTDAAGLLILDKDAPIGTALKSLYPEEIVFDVGITSNRPDWLSHHGVARELGVFLSLPCKPEFSSAPDFSADSSQALIEPGAACPFYSVQRWQNLRVEASPDWLRQRLELIGLRPINNIVDITNYVLHEFGQPLHAFDAAKIHGPIRVRTAREGEEFLALDGSRVLLCSADTVIADDVHVLALAGLMGGLQSGVTESTTEILLESALFTPAAIRRTARRTGLHTDSSYRFERGVDPEMILVAAQRAAELMRQIAGSAETACAGRFFVGALPGPLPNVSLRHARCRSLLGLELSDDEIITCLQKDRLELIEKSADASVWRIPSHRPDLLREVDLIEEVLRLVGIDRVVGRVGGGVAPRTTADHKFDALDRLRSILFSRGFFEARLSTLIAPAGVLGRDPVIALKNPLGEDQSILRPSLLPGLLTAAKRNFHSGQHDVRLFEAGQIYRPDVEEEIAAIGILATGKLWAGDWRLPDAPHAGLAFLRGVLEELFPAKLEFRPATLPGFVAGAEINSNGKRIGQAGILQPALSRGLDAPAEVLCAEVEWTSLLQPDSNPASKFKPFAKFPATRRDLALVLDPGVAYSQVADVLSRCREPLLIASGPFDVFQDESGEKLPADKKSVAVSLTFQSPERTLESSEVDSAVNRLRQALEEQLGAQIRS